MFWPCETRTSTCRSFATISSGLFASLPLQSSWMSKTYLKSDHFNGGGWLWQHSRADGELVPTREGLRLCSLRSHRTFQFKVERDQNRTDGDYSKAMADAYDTIDLPKIPRQTDLFINSSSAWPQ